MANFEGAGSYLLLAKPERSNADFLSIARGFLFKEIPSMSSSTSPPPGGGQDKGGLGSMNLGFLKTLTEKKTTRDGQTPKRRGPKPDSKPALTRRQELNRQAQRYMGLTPSAPGICVTDGQWQDAS